MTEIQKLSRMKDLISQINAHDYSYYVLDKPTVPDKRYDELYNELLALEAETGTIISGSPTQKVSGGVSDKLAKVKHTTTMLSCDKTKSIPEVVKFAKGKEVLGMHKLDGATIVLRYDGGEFQRAATRGRDGVEGEDVTENAKSFLNIPLTISYKGLLEPRGECVVTWSDFEEINAKLPVEDRYAHPRGLASSSARLLDSSLVKGRRLNFVAFAMTNDLQKELNYTTKKEELKRLEELGFEVVFHSLLKSADEIKTFIDSIDPKTCPYPIDGLVFEYNNVDYGNSLPCTSHHSDKNLAFKFADDAFETKFLGVELKTGRTGTVSITALFEPVEIDGSMVGRASVHNVDIFESYEFGVDDVCTVYKANMIIPQVYDNLTRSNTCRLSMTCPSCGGSLEIIEPHETRVLYCGNENCRSRLIQKFDHFCGKDAMNIDGVSEATLEVLIEKGWVTNFVDLYQLKNDDSKKAEIVKTGGFGKRSYEKMIDAIEKSRNTTLARFIVAMGITNIGRSASKTISKACNGDVAQFFELCKDKGRIAQLEDFGPKMCQNLYDWYANMPSICQGLSLVLDFEVEQPAVVATDSPFSGKTICITGAFDMGSRSVIQKQVEALGGKFTGSVSKKTDILLAGKDCGNKLAKAQECGTRIIEEEELMQILR